jgi:hypothetical protein
MCVNTQVGTPHLSEARGISSNTCPLLGIHGVISKSPEHLLSLEQQKHPLPTFSGLEMSPATQMYLLGDPVAGVQWRDSTEGSADS